MKKITVLVLTVILLAGCLGTASGTKTPEIPLSLTAPQNVTVEWLNGNDSPTTMSISYSVDPAITSACVMIAQAKEMGMLGTLLGAYGYTDIYITAQIDWALDDVNDPVSGWHYTKYWDDLYEYGYGRDEDGNNRYSEWDGTDVGLDNWTETVQTCWFMRGIPDGDRWNGNPETKTPGVKDQLRPDQYEYYEDSVHIDFTKHTAYFRVRFAVSAVKENEEGIKTDHFFSDWSEVAGYGRDAAKTEPLTQKDFKTAPVITNLHLTDKYEEGQPVVAYMIAIPEDIAETAAKAAATGGVVRIVTQGRLKGDNEWITLESDRWDVTPGEISVYLNRLLKEGETVVDGTKVELRCSFVGLLTEEDISSPWSEVLTFETTEIKDDPKPTPTAAPVEEEKKDDIKEEKKDKCPLCGFCPQPLGLCIFIWILIIVAIVAIVVVILVVKKKKEKNQS